MAAKIDYFIPAAILDFLEKCFFHKICVYECKKKKSYVK
jgi:hypothetical protein